jgi:tetratricopeptide (TPR) repeat protein
MPTPAVSPQPARLDRLLPHMERDPSNLALRKEVIRAACESGQWQAARVVLDVGLRLHPAEAELRALSGLVYMQTQQFREAELSLYAALGQGLAPAEVRYNLAYSQYMQGRYADALARLSSPLLPFELPVALLLRARCLHHLGFRQEAIEDCVGYLVQVPGDADAHGRLALLLYEVQSTEAAAQHAATALNIIPSQQEALLVTALLRFDLRDYEPAGRIYEQLVRNHPQCGRGWLGLALVKLAQAQIEAARGDVQLAARQMPDHIGTWHVLAWIELLLNDVTAAQAAFDRALALDRNFGETHGGLAITAALQGRHAEARASIKRALRLDSASMSARYAEMILLRHAGQDAAAQESIDAVLARPAAQGDMRLRDVVTLHLKRLMVQHVSSFTADLRFKY